MTAFWWAVTAACIWGIVPIIEKLGLTKVEPLVGLFYRSIGVVIGLFILGTLLVKPHQIRSVDVRSAGLLIFGGFLASCLAQIAFYHGLKLGDVSRVVPIAGSFPLIAAVLGFLLFKEALTPFKAAGIFMIVAGIWMLKLQ